jgi:hypothetical protein
VDRPQLAANLQLTTLELDDVCLDLPPDHRIVLGAALKQLRVNGFRLYGDAAGRAALSLLPAGLEHLSIRFLYVNGRLADLPSSMFQQLQQLTYLELAGMELQPPNHDQNALQLLTQPVDLRLEGRNCWQH